MKKILLSLLVVLTAVLALNFYPVAAQTKANSLNRATKIKAKTARSKKLEQNIKLL